VDMRTEPHRPDRSERWRLGRWDVEVQYYDAGIIFSIPLDVGFLPASN
jgi:hypothetical protein